MKTFTVTEQVASHLRQELRQGRWSGVMPGRDRLARELGVHGSTVVRALGLLEQEGLLESAGAGRRRRIVAEKIEPRGTRVVIILYEPEDALSDKIMTMQQHLHAAGHRPVFSAKAMSELRHDPKRIMAMMEGHPAEAWICVAGVRPVLEELSKAATPTFALFGYFGGIPLAGTGPDKLEALRECIGDLYRKGRRRMVMLARAERVRTGVGNEGKVLFEELSKRNLPHSSYNMPDWGSTPEELHRCLEALFQVTPPDVILVDDWSLSFAIQNHLSRRQGPAYRKVECVYMDDHPSFTWCRPAVSHFSWDTAKVIRRVVRWVDHIAQGKEDKSQRLIKAKFVPGG